MSPTPCVSPPANNNVHKVHPNTARPQPAVAQPHSTPPTLSTQHQQMETHKRAYDLPSTRALIEYLHATAGYPMKATWIDAIKACNYKSWPGLTLAAACT